MGHKKLLNRSQQTLELLMCVMWCRRVLSTISGIPARGRTPAMFTWSYISGWFQDTPRSEGIVKQVLDALSLCIGFKMVQNKIVGNMGPNRRSIKKGRCLVGKPWTWFWHLSFLEALGRLGYYHTKTGCVFPRSQFWALMKSDTGGQGQWHRNCDVSTAPQPVINDWLYLTNLN